MRSANHSGASAPVSGSEWFEYFSAKYGAENVRWSRIPEFTGPKSKGGTGTIGVLRTRHGDFDVISGRDGPAASMSGNGFDIVSRMHAEGHAVNAHSELTHFVSSRIDPPGLEWVNQTICLV